MMETGAIAMLVRIHQTPPGTLFDPPVIAWAPLPLGIVAVERADRLLKARRRPRLRVL